MLDTVTQLQSETPAVSNDPIDILTEWVSTFHAAISAHDVAATADLFQTDAVARDLLAGSWDFRNGVNREEVAQLYAGAVSIPIRTIQLREGFAPLQGSDEQNPSLETFLTFENAVGTGNGHVRLIQEDDGTWRAAAFTLVLDELHEVPKRHGAHRPVGRAKTPVLGRKTWTEEFDPDFEAKDPDVVIVGAGHNGLMLAARLQVMGISVLLVEKNNRVGDNWRKRYSSLALHTPLASDSFPYIPYPDTWTLFTPKDKFADFLESYAKLMDLRVWTGSEASNFEYDEKTGHWALDVKRADGKTRSLNPKHLVVAPGLLTEPLRPNMPGQDLYQGTVLHTADYRGHAEWHGKKAIVVGTGVSGHDIAQDLAEHGVDVTMIQRSETIVLSTSSFHKVMHTNHISGTYSVEDADIVNSATPFGELPRYGAAQLAAANDMDKELLDGLRQAGFRLGCGPDGTGVLGLIFGQNGTGYYYNAGASELIIDGSIALEHGSVTGFNEHGVILNDGEKSLSADLVVFATGYQGPDVLVREMFGDEVADQLEAFADVGEDREYGRLWRHSGIDRFWFMIALGIGDGRFYSNLLALQIAADLAGITPGAEA